MTQPSFSYLSSPSRFSPICCHPVVFLPSCHQPAVVLPSVVTQLSFSNMSSSSRLSPICRHPAVRLPSVVTQPSSPICRHPAVRLPFVVTHPSFSHLSFSHLSSPSRLSPSPRCTLDYPSPILSSHITPSLSLPVPICYPCGVTHLFPSPLSAYMYYICSSSLTSVFSALSYLSPRF